MGKWLDELMMTYKRGRPPLDPQGRKEEQSQRASSAIDTGNIGPNKVYDNTKCLFCGVDKLDIEGSIRRHIERHMEEIAFAVVSKSYEEWEFYSDSSSGVDF